MKYLVLFSLIISCFASVWAEGEPTTTPTINPTAEQYSNSVNTFSETYLKNVMTDADYSTFMGKIDDYVKNVTEATGYFPTTFMGDVNGIVSAALSNTSLLGNAQCADIKKDYLYDLSSFLEGYAYDMSQNAGTVIGTAAYVSDFRNLTANMEQKCRNKLTPPTTEDATAAVADDKDPKDYLDSVIGTTRVTAKIDFVWEGVNENWTQTLASLVGYFKDYFSDNQVALADIALLETIWPQASEVYTMNGSYANYDGTPSSTYFVNEYGAIDTATTDGQASVVESSYTSASYTADHTYNNRSYGFSTDGSHDGNYTTVKLTVNNHEYALQQHFFTSPLVLDLDGDGKLEASKGKWMPHTYDKTKVVEFDMDGDGFIDLTEWVGVNDGLLLVHKGNDVSANDLFGNAGGYNNGYEKLSLLDENNDGKISDKELSTLSVWQDKNGNAKVDAGEISSVQSLGITSISVKYDGQYVSSFEQNGSMKKMWDWFPNVFVVKKR